MKNIIKSLCMALVVFSATSNAFYSHVESEGLQFDISLKGVRNITAKEKVAIDNFFKEISKIVPESVKEVLNRTIEIDIVPLGKEIKISPDCPSQGEREELFWLSQPVFTSAKSWHYIKMNQALIREMLLGPEHSETLKCGHKNMYRFTQAALINALIKIYAQSAKLNFSKNSQFMNVLGFSRGWLG